MLPQVVRLPVPFFTHSWLLPTMACHAPLDEDGFVVSFSVDADNAADIQRFFHDFGFVVISDVLNDDECNATIREFWEHHAGEGLDPSKPATWDSFWERQHFGRLGIIGMFPDFASIRQLENRQNPRVHEAFARVLGTHELWVDFDRLGIMRPTVDIDMNDGLGPREMEQWRTLSDWLHLDCNPTVGFASIGGYNDSGESIDFQRTTIIQGLLTLSEARAVDGGFHCVPGSHKLSQQWAAANQCFGTRSNMQVPKDDVLQQQVQKIPVRKGCLLVWNSLLFHGNHPNFSKVFRAVQYIRCMPIYGTPYSPLISDKDAFPEEFNMSHLGQNLFGLRTWERSGVSQ